MQAKPFHHAMRTVIALAVFSVLALEPGRVAAHDIVVAAWNTGSDTEVAGPEADIIRHVMERCGHGVRFATFPFTRHWIAFLQGTVDAVATVPGHLDLPLTGTEAFSHIHFENGVLVRAEDGLQIDWIEDLRGLRVASFAGARNLLSEVAAITEVAESYVEIADISEQIALLVTGRVDAVYGDGRILAEVVHMMRGRASDRLRSNAGLQLRFFPIARSPPFHLVFRDPQMAHDFNHCLMNARLAGEIAAILAGYDEQQAAMFPTPCNATGQGVGCEAAHSSWLSPAAGVSPAP